VSSNMNRLPRRAISKLRRLSGRQNMSGPGHSDLDRWLVPLFDQQLAPIEASIGSQGLEGYRQFRGLDDDLWALLLTREYEAYPAIRSFLPGLPRPELQQQWNGASGPALASQTVCFYRKLKEVQARYGRGDLAGSAVLDFGCGWGRLTRMVARDVEPGDLYGCDPVEDILEICRETGVPAELFRSDFLPERLPVERRFDLVFAFSVLTHVSEKAARASFEAIAERLEPGGLFAFTIRPISYLDVNPLMRPAAEELGDERTKALDGPAYLFVPHEAEDHPQYDGNEMAYGESVITIPWIRENWTDGFDLVDVSVMLGDFYQVAVTLRKR